MEAGDSGSLGSLSVQITGDYSQLIQAINDAQGAATAGSQSIVDAVNTAGAAADQASGKFGEMAEALAGIGEALAVTEGLKEFGEEALNAYGTVQSVTIGLTQLTGSADTANEAIENIKQLASTEPFAFPEIAPTIQKMVALGVSAEQLPSVMQAVADASAATGNSFQQVANSLDRMSLSGTAGARQLTQLGISTTDLGTAMGVTSDQVTTAFKALDQSQRLDVLTTALAKFAGSAEAQAQGIAGQWQIFQNEFEEVMVGVGEALAPAIEDILDFGKGALEAAQTVMAAWNELPEPFREVIGVVGVAAASLAPLALAASTLGFALIGIQGVIGPVNTLLEALGLAGGEAAAGETAAATAATELGTAVEGASAGIVTAEATTASLGEAAALSVEGVSALGIGLGGLAIVLAGPLIASLIATKSNLDDLKAKWDDVLTEMQSHSIIQAVNAGATVQQLQAIGDSITQIKAAYLGLGVSGATVSQQLSTSLDAPINTLQKMGIATTDIQTALKGVQVGGVSAFQALANSNDFASFSDAVKLLGGNLDQIIQKLNSLPQSATEVKTAVAALNTELGISVTATTAVNKGWVDLQATQVQANQAVKDAQGVLTLAKSALDGTTLSQQNYQAALAAYDKAVQAASPHTKDYADTLAGVESAAILAQEKEQSLAVALTQAQAAFDAGQISAGLFVEVYNKAQAAAKALGDNISDLEAEIVKLNTTAVNATTTFSTQQAVFAQLVILYQNGQISLSELEAGYKNVKTAGDAVGTTFYNQAAAMLAANQAAADQGTTLKDNIATLGGLSTQALQTDQTLLAEANVFKTIQSEAAAMGVTITDVGGVYSATAKVITPAIQSIIDQINAWAKADGLKTSVLQQGYTVVSDATTGIITYKGGVEAATAAVQAHTAALAPNHSALSQQGGDLANAATGLQNAGYYTQQLNTVVTASGSIIYSWSDALDTAASSLNGVASAATSAAQAVDLFDDATNVSSTSGASGQGTTTGTSGIAGVVQLMEMLGAPGSSISGFLGASGFVQTGIGGSGGAGTNYESVSDYNASITALAAKLNDSVITSLDAFGNTLDALGPPLKSDTTATSTQAAATTTATTAVAALGTAAASTSDVVTNVANAVTTFGIGVTGVGNELAFAHQASDAAGNAFAAMNEALAAAGISYGDLTAAQQQNIESQLQQATAAGETVAQVDALATSLVAATQNTTTLATATATAASTIAQASTIVSNAAVAVAATAISVLASVPGANALASGITSSTGLNFTGLTLAPSTPGSGGLVGIITPGTGQETSVGGSQPLAVTLQNTGMIVGTNGMQQLAQLLMPQIVTALRQAGAKV